MSSKIPSQVERDLPEFVVDTVLGAGSSSMVYRATQRTLGRHVAIKRLSPDSLMPENMRQRFEREAAMWAHFSHENLIHLYDYRTTPQARYIVLEYCDGLEVRQLMNELVTIPPQIAACIIYQALSALEYIHRFDIVHRDIKPTNMFLTNQGVVKLMDFGISLCPELEPMTEPGQILGTPAYMSPEQALGQEIDSRSDLFSLGTVLYEMLEGVRPLQSLEFADIMRELEKGKYRRISGKHPRAMRGFVDRCLQRKVARRFESATAAKDFLDVYLRREKLSSPRVILESYLRGRGLVARGEPSLFPKNVAEVTAGGPLGTTFAYTKTHADLERPSRFRVWILIFFGVALVALLYSLPPSLKPDWREIWTFMETLWRKIP